jgi:hypothetical protein
MTTGSDDYFGEEQMQGNRGSVMGIVWDVLSGILVAASLVVALVFLILFINPQSGLNPLPPTTVPPPIVTHTPSPTPKQVLPPTWTPGPSPTPQLSPTAPQSTDTPVPPTPTQANGEENTPSGDSQVSFVVSEESPTYTENFVHEEEGCQWLGVAGQVFDENGEPISQILVEAGGFLDDQEISFLTLTGMADEYGEGGYEIVLAEEPVASQNSVWIQLLDQTNLPFSDKVYFNTYESCDQNLVLIDFVQETPSP